MKLVLFLTLFISAAAAAQTPYTRNGEPFDLTSQLSSVKGTKNMIVVAKGRNAIGDGWGNFYMWCDSCTGTDTTLIRNASWAPGEAWFPLLNTKFFSNPMYTTQIFSRLSDSVQTYNGSGRVYDVIKVWQDSVNLSGAGPTYTFSIASANFSKINSIMVTPSYGTATLLSPPSITEKSHTLTSVTLNVSLLSGVLSSLNGLKAWIRVSGN